MALNETAISQLRGRLGHWAFIPHGFQPENVPTDTFLAIAAGMHTLLSVQPDDHKQAVPGFTVIKSFSTIGIA